MDLGVALVTPDSPPCLVGVEVHVHRLARGLAPLACDGPVITQVVHDDPHPGIATLKQGLTIPRFPDWTRSNWLPVAPPVKRYLSRDADTFHIVPSHSLRAWAPSPASGAAACTFQLPTRCHGTVPTAKARTLDRVLHPVATRIFRSNSAPPINRGDGEPHGTATSFDRWRSTPTSRRGDQGLRVCVAHVGNRMALFPTCCSSTTATGCA